ncbi:MAG: serine/threonine-protein kinase [Archangium sp.]
MSTLGTLGKYTLVKKLATGGMAEVFLARAEGPGGFAKKCVVKRILPHFNDDPRFTEMFLGEARLAAELNHPNLVQIFDFGQHNGQYFLCMEFIDGPNVRVLNQAARRDFGAMDFAVAARLISTAAEGLHYAHELRDEAGNLVNLVHRDISPDNILVSRSGAVKVVDFGIAKASTQPHLTKSGMIKGKMAYMPPEQLAREPLDRRADLFALGIVLYELITGGMPFDATSEVSIIQAIMSVKPLERPTVYRPDCPPELEAIVTKCLEKDREKRYPSCRELQSDLEAFIQKTGKTVGTREISTLVTQLFKEQESSVSGVRSNPGVPTPDHVGLDRTQPSLQSRERESVPSPAAGSPATPAPAATGLSSTALREVSNPGTGSGGGSSKAPFAIVGGLLVVGLGIGGWWAFNHQPDDPPIAQVVDAGTVTPPVLIVDAAVAFEPEVDAGTPVVVEPAVDAGEAVAVVIDAGTGDVKNPVKVKNGSLVLRIRPYANVFLDDKLLGETPLPAQSVPVGKHKLKLVNPTLGTVTLDVTIKPGENIVKHNFKE